VVRRKLYDPNRPRRDEVEWPSTFWRHATITRDDAYACKFGEEEEKWGIVGLLHDFGYERWPDPPDHPLKGAEILAEHGYPEDVINAIKSHADYLTDCPRLSVMDKTLYACDELAGFCTAVAMIRPQRIRGMKAKSVKKLMVLQKI